MTFFKKIIWWIIYRIHPKHKYHVCPTGLKPGYYDIPDLITYVNFKFIERFVEDEKCFEFINWEINMKSKLIKKELEEIYNYWKVIRPNYEKKLNQMYKSLPNFENYYNINELKDVNNKCFQLEAKIIKYDTRYLHRIINIKNYLWT